MSNAAEDPPPPGVVKLQDFDPSAWRIRVGEYRVVYEVHRGRLMVIVINGALRGEVYR